MSKNYLFVYGTLLSTLKYKAYFQLLKYTQFINKAHTYGKLYLISYYPGLDIASQKDKIKGELYLIKDAKLFTWLDEYEGVNEQTSYYLRQKIKVYTSVQEYLAWSYILKKASPKFTYIASGDFTVFWQKNFAY